ncbi:hypothetical protein F2P44_21605 [Massilia sp. CCM 8695]|uniref:Uncharacterized protein n=1 Tax=Massilia frigida TaxID=2609281 RepID=A0ABX0N9V5_9BURK|nr:hypothetical protein [Massilia frigida]NHZ81852.1 hypothetical protein [Massilia frigida]
MEQANSINKVSSRASDKSASCNNATKGGAILALANPHFHHIERAPYELGCLLRRLPPYLSDPALTDEQRDLAAAAAEHASNYSTSLLAGLESLGRIMWCAALNDEQQVEHSDFADVGQLVASLATQLQYLNFFHGEVELHVHRDVKKGAA